jgi:undecaprenyl diphosphate synthase
MTYQSHTCRQPPGGSPTGSSLQPPASSLTPSQSRLHVALILDGNGRWATARGLPRPDGHKHGIRGVRRVVRAAHSLGIGTLTLYAFSSDNWRRPPGEVASLMRVLDEFVRREARRCIEHGVRVSVIGRRDRLPPRLVDGIRGLEAATLESRLLHVRLAIDYSGRDAIWYAAERAVRCGLISREQFTWAVRSGRGEPAHVPDVDLLIRTGGERRLSDFLLWEIAYAELYFTDTMWPDFTCEHLAAALAWFRARDRRFGGLPAAGAARPSKMELSPGRART